MTDPTLGAHGRKACQFWGRALDRLQAVVEADAAAEVSAHKHWPSEKNAASISEGVEMNKPAVVQFEITGKDSAALSRFYASLFGWEMQETPTPGYHVVRANETGIPGGIGPSRDGGSGQVTFYVEVANLQQCLSYAEELGGKIIGPPHEVRSPDGAFTFAFVADPEGHVVGLSQGLQRGLEQFAARFRR